MEWINVRDGERLEFPEENGSIVDGCERNEDCTCEECNPYG